MSKLMRVLRLVGVGVLAGFLTLELPVAAEVSVLDSTRNDYRTCANTLLRLQIPADQVAIVCGRAFKPEDVSTCVQRTSQDGKLPVDPSLAACRAVRRPIDLASCVVDIRRSLNDAPPLDVLERCRQSLLPQRYADCVTGINQRIKENQVSRLTTCIDANDFPRELDYTFVPYPTVPGSLNPPVPSNIPAPTQPGSSPSVTPLNPNPGGR